LLHLQANGFALHSLFEVKGRSSDAKVLTVTRNEILYSLNKPDDFILAIVQFEGAGHSVHYVNHPFQKEPDFGVIIISTAS
jgi:uncharacterized OB-fold protein